jgi:hypothetical protein
MLKRCGKGTKRNKKTGLCEPNKINERSGDLKKQETLKNKKQQSITKIKNNSANKKKRCEKGTKRNKKTGLCESNKINERTITNIIDNSEKQPIKNIKISDGKKTSKERSIKEINNSEKQPIKKIEMSNEKKTSKERNIKQKQIIQRFFLKNKSKIKTNYLKHICSSAGDCLSFGKETENINKLFHNFVDFSYVEFPIKRIGALSGNAFISMLKYKKYGYECYAILKSSKNLKSDNLYYEYLVGRDFINHYKNYFPCFVETYGIFKFNNANDWNDFQNERFPLNQEKLKSCLTDISDYPEEEIIKLSCNDEANMISILCEHINVRYSFKELLNELLEEYQISNRESLRYLLPNSLYQIYLPLYYLRKVYSHNDLHKNNILCFPVTTKNGNLGYINLNYIIKDKTYTLRSEYILKIIDYGRSYYNYDDKRNTNIIMMKFFKEKLGDYRDLYGEIYDEDIKLYHKGDYLRYNKLLNIKKPADKENNLENNFINFITDKNTTDFFDDYYKNRECIGEINIYTNKLKTMETKIYP